MDGHNGIFSCVFCKYSCKHRGDWRKHLATVKHKRLAGSEEVTQALPSQTSEEPRQTVLNKVTTAGPFVCDCGKSYVHERNLKRHLAKCTTGRSITITKDESTELIRNLVAQNERIQEQINGMNQGQTIVNQTIQNGDYKPQYITAIKDSQVNMQIYLNETCNKAINLSSFIENLEVNLEDLDETRERGLAYSIGRVMLRGLKELEFNQRPIHCSDIQKSQMYIRDNDCWDVDKHELQLRSAIGLLSAKQINQIKEWESRHADWYNSDDGKEVYADMIRKVLQPSREMEKMRIENDVIKAIAKETLIPP